MSKLAVHIWITLVVTIMNKSHLVRILCIPDLRASLMDIQSIVVNKECNLAHISNSVFIVPFAQRSCWGYISFTPFVRPPVCLSVRPAFRVRYVTSTDLVGSIWYVYIWATAEGVSRVKFLANLKIKIFGIFFKFVSLTPCFDMGSDVDHSYG